MSQLPLFRDAPSSKDIANRRNDVRTGKSGEHLVLAKLTRWGYDAHDAPPDAAYDVIVDHGGVVLRIQVKTRSAATGFLVVSDGLRIVRQVTPRGSKSLFEAVVAENFNNLLVVMSATDSTHIVPLSLFAAIAIFLFGRGVRYVLANE